MALSEVSGMRFSKQALWKRISPAFNVLLRKLLERTIQDVSLNRSTVDFYGNYKRVLLEDTTCVRLPDAMHPLWKGNHSKGKQKSVVKFHLIHDIISGNFKHFDLHPYSTPEQKIGCKIFDIAREGDLVLRDLGYFVLEYFTRLCERKIHFVSRLRYGVKLFDPKTGKELRLSTLIGKKEVTDKLVLLGNGKTCQVRLVAIKLNEKAKQTRIRKAKNDRNKRHNHSQEYYRMLGYIFFITNIDQTQWDAQKIAQSYRSRWNIEILFKCWKSNFRIQRAIPKVSQSKHSMEAILLLTMLFLAWFQRFIAVWILGGSTHKISIRKVAAYFINNIELILKKTLTQSELKKIIHHCRHEPRLSRSNAVQLIDDLYYH